VTLPSTAYDEVPYRSAPVEWTAPERLALASLLHGGPRQSLDGYRLLEVGCGDGSNLIPLAYYRRNAEFVGIDAARTHLEIAEKKRHDLGLANLALHSADIASAGQVLTGQFDYILVHGVFSWIGNDARDSLLELCAHVLRPGGLLYVNYNARPGWNVRGLIRDFLLAQTAKIAGLRARTDKAREIADRMARELSDSEHPYMRLLANEFRFVGENDPSHTAHEYLAPHNQAYWRRAFLNLVGVYGFVYVGDADYNYPSGRLPDSLASHLARLELDPDAAELTADLLYYRQLHSPILTRPAFARKMPDAAEIAALSLASPLVRSVSDDQGIATFDHPSGVRVEAKSEAMAHALSRLQAEWPAGKRLDELFADVSVFLADLGVLHRNRLVEVRLIEPSSLFSDPAALQEVERRWGAFTTSPSHTVTFASA
jgi:SAM-dependent methyltransferase